MKTIYLDIDNVLADFARHVWRTLTVEEVQLPWALIEGGGWDLGAHLTPQGKEDFEKLCLGSERFWLTMPTTPYAHKIVDLAKAYADEVVFITAPSGELDNLFDIRQRWLQAEFPQLENFRLLMTSDKHVYAEPGCLLVDDKPDNCELWTTHGGEAFLWFSAWQPESVRACSSEDEAFATLQNGLRGDFDGPSEQELSWLAQAQACVSGDRQRDYGHPSDNFRRIAQMWEPIFRQSVSNAQVAQAMIALKLARDINTHKDDNWVDILGYVLAYEQTR